MGCNPAHLQTIKVVNLDLHCKLLKSRNLLFVCKALNTHVSTQEVLLRFILKNYVWKDNTWSSSEWRQKENNPSTRYRQRYIEMQLLKENCNHFLTITKQVMQAQNDLQAGDLESHNQNDQHSINLRYWICSIGIF